MLWTQGRLYGFREGDTIYDTSQAYTGWGEALKHLKLVAQVQSALPSSYVTYETIEVKNSELEIIHKKGKAKEEVEIIDGLVVNKQRIDHGWVKFKVYRPNDGKTAVEECETIECTQDDFVAFLQTGIIRTKENKLVNLFAEKP